MKINRINGILLLCFFFFSCTSIADKEIQESNVKYGEGERQVLDIYLPKGRNEKTPFVILVHGGGWVEGDKSDLATLQSFWLSEGIASAAINYTYASSDVHYETLMKDVDAAIAFLSERASIWKYRKTGYILGGYSAGGHLAFLYALRGYDKNNRIQAVISASGALHLSEPGWLYQVYEQGGISDVEKMAGATFAPSGDSSLFMEGKAAVPDNFKKADPMHSERGLPALIVHGTQDEIVPFEHALSMKEHLHGLGSDVKFISLEAGHDLNLSNIPGALSLFKQMADWIKEQEPAEAEK